MHTKNLFRTSTILITLISLFLASCSSSAPTATPALPTAPPATTPDWFNIELTDVSTGKTFTINDFAGKVVLVETMAEWCPNCQAQQDEVKKLHELLGNTSDLVSVSLDVDMNEEAASLKTYAADRGYDWRFAIAPLEVARALGNLYSAQYLNPPVSPMLIIDRQGNVYGLPYGGKSAESLQKTIAPYLTP